MMRRISALAAILPILLVACDRFFPEKPDLALPPIEEVRALYREQGVDGDVAYNGNVVEITVAQPREQLRRGGALWARVGPYVFLLTPATKTVFETWAGIAAVRVITHTPDDIEIARATLLRAAMRQAAWREAHNHLARAITLGTEQPRLIEKLVHFGERYTEYRYNPRFVPRRSPPS